MRHSPQMQNPAGGRGFAKTHTSGLHANRIAVEAAPQPGNKLAPFAKDVAGALAAGRSPNVFLFAGAGAWDRAKKRRQTHGADCALVLPDGENPLALRWPPLDSVLVAWPGCDNFERKVDLARALVRDGVRHVQIEHIGEWITAKVAA